MTPDAWLPPADVKISEDERFEYLVQQGLLRHRVEQRVRAVLRGERPTARERWLDEDGLDALQDPGWIVQGLLPDTGFSLLVGREGSMKSLVALGIAAAMVSETQWLGRDVEPGPVVFVAAEGLNGTKMRWRAQKRRLWIAGATVKHGIRFDYELDMQDDDMVEDFADAVAEFGARLVVVDTLARTAVGANDSSSQDMGLFVRNVDRIVAAANCAVLVLHHSSKGKDGDAVRGSTALAGAAYCVLHAVKEDRGLTTIKNPKMKDAANTPDFPVAFVPVEGTYSGLLDHPNMAQLAALAERSSSNRTELVLDMIKSNPGTRQQDIATATGLAKTTVFNIVKSLRDDGFVNEVRVGRTPTYVALGAES